MIILVVNTGSSSLKYQLINMENEAVLAKGLCERIGEDGHMVVTPSSSNCQTVGLNLRGQDSVTVHLPENPWYHEVQDIGRIVAAGDYDFCYQALNTTHNVVEVLEKARAYAGFGF